MKRIFGIDQLKLERRIVEELGNGQLRADMYLFDQVKTATPGIVSERQSVPVFLKRVRDVGTVIAFFDRAPDNLWCAAKCLDPKYHELIVAHELDADELRPLLECSNCDLYILSRTGHLMAIPTHEDVEDAGQRLIWVIQSRSPTS